MSKNDLLFETVSKIESFHAIPGGVRMSARTDAETCLSIEITFTHEDVVRFRLFQKESQPAFPLVRLPAVPQKVIVSQSADGVTLKNDHLTCRIGFAPFEWRILDGDGHPVWWQQRNDTNVRGSSNVPACGLNTSQGRIVSVLDSFGLDPEERIYGFGEKFFAHDKRGHTLTSWNKDAYGVETERAYKNIPFFLSTRGYGVLINSTACIKHAVGDPDVSRATYLVEIDDDEMDYFVIANSSFQSILRRCHDLTGDAPVPPKWAFGLWMSRCYFHNRQTAEEVADKLRKLEIPSDVLVFDGYWVRDAHQCDLLWDEERFNQPAQMLAGLKAKGFKSCVWEGPFVPSGTEMFEEGEKGGYLLHNPQGQTYLIDTGLVMASHNQENFKGQETAGSFDGLPPAPPAALVDFTNPEAVKWIQQKHVALLDLGVDVFKTDFGEQVPEDAVSPCSGLTGKRLHNLYTVLYNKAVFETTQRHHGRGLVWARSAGIGSQQYPVHWGGDPQTSFSSLAGSLRGGLSLGLSGVPFWGSDIGGFFGPKPTARLYVRWAEMGLLSGVSRCHGTTPREPWEYGQEALEIFRKYARLRYRLLPYLNSSACNSARSSLPLMRPLVLDWQDDPAAQVVDSQYLLGEWLMVAPVLSERDERWIYLPEGDWLDYWTGKCYRGPVSLRYPAPLDVLPLFIRSGAIIPLGPEMNYVGEKPVDPVTLMVYPGSQSSHLFIDDQEETLISCRSEGNQVTLKVGASQKNYQLQFWGLHEPVLVKANGETLPRVQALSTQKPCWEWMPPDRCSISTLRAPFEICITHIAD